MKCRDFDIALHMFFFGELPPEQKPDLLRHARSCTRCDDLMKAAHELTCKEFVEFLADYCDGLLPAEREAIFKRHLSICPECTAYLESYRRTIHLTAASSEESDRDALEEVPKDLIRAIVSSMKRK